MNYNQLETGHIVEFRKDGQRAEGTVRSVGPSRVHIQSGDTGVYVDPNDVIRVVRIPADNEIPLLGERFRLGGGL